MRGESLLKRDIMQEILCKWFVYHFIVASATCFLPCLCHADLQLRREHNPLNTYPTDFSIVVWFGIRREIESVTVFTPPTDWELVQERLKDSISIQCTCVNQYGVWVPAVEMRILCIPQLYILRVPILGARMMTLNCTHFRDPYLLSRLPPQICVRICFCMSSHAKQSNNTNGCPLQRAWECPEQNMFTLTCAR